VKESAVRTDINLEAFCGEKYRPLGKISLPVTLGSYPQIRTELMDFYIITGSRTLDMIIGRSGLLSFRAIPSTIHSTLMFPTRSGVVMVRGIRENEEQFGRGPQVNTFQRIQCFVPIASPNWMNQQISFVPQNECVPTDKALVVDGRIKGSKVSKILVDSGSSTKIMYDHYFRTLPETEQRKIAGREEVKRW
jgi:hypothetical protein